MKRMATLALVAAALWAPVRADDKDGIRKTPAGFTNLLDEKAWKLDGKQALAWKIADNMIIYTGKGGQNLKTAKKYKDFEFWCDWKITKGGDSGIYLRGQPQVQIWDNKEGSGGLWNNPAKSPGKVPLVYADNKVGEWNTFYIKMVGTKVSVKLNDKLVVDNADMLAGKVPPEGTIELQVHGSPLWFRNVFVKEL